MSAEPVLVNRDGEVTRVTLHRPEKANALSAELVESLLGAVERAGSDGTRVLVIAGSGPHFCAGFDFTGYDTASDGDLALRFIRIEMLLQALYYSPFETVALAQGRVFGAGADIVASCSTRVAAPDASFLLPGLKFGLVLGTRRFAARVGNDAARDILSASRVFGAAEALRIGFLTHIAEGDATEELASAIFRRARGLEFSAKAALLEATRRNTGSEDLAALARSVARPGLGARIRAFRESQNTRTS